MIDKNVLRFGAALFVGALLIEGLDHISNKAAWAVVLLLVLGLFLNNPILIGYLQLFSKDIQEVV